jgi:hypothetical protein
VLTLLSPGSVNHAFLVAVQYVISSPGFICAPDMAHFPLYLAIIVFCMSVPHQKKNNQENSSQ